MKQMKLWAIAVVMLATAFALIYGTEVQEEVIDPAASNNAFCHKEDCEASDKPIPVEQSSAVDSSTENDCQLSRIQCPQVPEAEKKLCPKGNVGDNCEFPGPCVSDPCLNDGLCCMMDKLGAYTCMCQQNWTGFYCEFPDPCQLDNPCKNGGTCNVDKSTGGYSCTCAENYIGLNCELEDPCKRDEDYCHNNGLCITNSMGQPFCICENGYSTQDQCETKISNCVDEDVCNKGWCGIVDHNVKCYCGDKYKGEYCQYAVTCDDNPCENGGSCSADEETYKCSCAPGFFGVRCEIIDEYFNQSQRCVKDRNGDFQCFCKPGHSGTFCTEKVQTCNAVKCLNGGKCKEGAISLMCICGIEFEGDNCEKRKGVCASSYCSDQQLCTVDSDGYPVCFCKPGFSGPNCDIMVTNCGAVQCFNSGTCIEDDGAFSCQCNNSYQGKNCENLKVPICDNEENVFCMNGGTCESGACNCGSDYEGEFCQWPKGTCGEEDCPSFEKKCSRNRDGEFKCFCKPGYSGDTCSDEVTKCRDVLCLNGGICTTDPTLQCVCGPEYEGDNCEERIGLCASFACTDQQLCALGGDGYPVCFCRPGKTGRNCDVAVSSCDDVVCFNGGSCSEVSDEYICKCLSGFTGKNCEKLQGSPTRKETSRPAVKKPFCPTVYTIGERGGCVSCSHSKENCEGCCDEKKILCKEECARLVAFCRNCKEDVGQCHVSEEDEKGLKEKCDQGIDACVDQCDAKRAACASQCQDEAGGTACPEVFSCSKVGTKQCRALKDRFGNIECVYNPTQSAKEDYHSYIKFPRIHFAGKVQIDTATLNNVFENFDIKKFSSADTKVNSVDWNPSGTGAFRFVDVSVTRACSDTGSCTYLAHDDPLAGATIEDQANGKVPAKLVDLDVEVQGRVSEVYGLSLDVGGFFKGDMERASFQSLWYKMVNVPDDDYGEGSRLQSVLNNVQFSSQTSGSKIVEYFRKNIGPNRKLSICFNVDMMAEHLWSNYTFGRIVGSIGLAGEKAPYFFDHGRLLRRLTSTNLVNDAPFTVDETNLKIYIDLGNSLGINRHGYVLKAVGGLALGVYNGQDGTVLGVEVPNCLDDITWISRIYYDEYGGYRFTGGINVIDLPEYLKEKVYKQFVLAKIDESGECQTIYLAENQRGINVRSKSHFVFRAQHENVVSGELFVTIFGKDPVGNTPCINLQLVNASSIITPRHAQGPSQPFGIFKDEHRPSIYKFYFYAMTDTNNIREIIDGEVYTLQYTFDGYPLNPDRNQAMNSAIFIHVYDKETERVETTTWLGTVRPIFTVYANLFPVMKSFVDLGDYGNVVLRKCHILTAMALDFDDPQFMPVTRDLSPKKTELILHWLDLDKPPFGMTYEDALTKKNLLNMLQVALQLEHSTLPIYLNGYFSMKPWENTQVKEMLHQIIVEEMFHFAQVANIINALGGRPYLLGNDFVPTFPTHLPGGCRPNMIATINKISLQQVHDVYMQIEEPSYVVKENELVALINTITEEQLLVPLTGNQQDRRDYRRRCEEALALFPLPDKELTQTKHDTIGDFYMSVVYLLGRLSICGLKDIFTGRTKQLTWSNPRLLREVHSYNEALGVIQSIVDQGEGASPYNPLQQNFNSSDLAHYFKFASIYHGRELAVIDVTHEKVYKKNKENLHDNYVYLGDKISLFEDGVWPMVDNPQMSKYKPNSQAYKNAQAFNDMYRKLLETLQSVFDGNVGRFDDTFGLMKSLMVHGNRVVQTPIEEGGNPEVGPNAGPTYFN